MPCSFPLQAIPTSMRHAKTGKRVFCISRKLRAKFFRGEVLPENCQGLPCGRCMWCRLERSRQMALRCVHESKLYNDSCFITLTYDDDNLVKQCRSTSAGYSLNRDDVTLFIKRLRKRFDHPIRVYGCGEYGDKTARPHYHFCIFNCGFNDRELWRKVNGFRYYNSKLLSDCWGFGHSVVGGFSFETAAYVARYCCKKVLGPKAELHYAGRIPEFSVYPTRGGGIGKPWYEKFGATDVEPTDSCVARGVVCKVPRYYDKLRERADPEQFAWDKLSRAARAKLRTPATPGSLLSAEKCMNARIRLLLRKLD